MNIGRFNVLEGKDTILNYRISVHWLLHIPGSYGGKSPDLNWWFPSWWYHDSSLTWVLKIRLGEGFLSKPCLLNWTGEVTSLVFVVSTTLNKWLVFK